MPLNAASHWNQGHIRCIACNHYFKFTAADITLRSASRGSTRCPRCETDNSQWFLLRYYPYRSAQNGLLDYAQATIVAAANWIVQFPLAAIALGIGSILAVLYFLEVTVYMMALQRELISFPIYAQLCLEAALIFLAAALPALYLTRKWPQIRHEQQGMAHNVRPKGLFGSYKPYVHYGLVPLIGAAVISPIAGFGLSAATQSLVLDRLDSREVVISHDRLQAELIRILPPEDTLQPAEIDEFLKGVERALTEQNIATYVTFQHQNVFVRARLVLWLAILVPLTGAGLLATTFSVGQFLAGATEMLPTPIFADLGLLNYVAQYELGQAANLTQEQR